jgi:hypothetical protein
MMSAAGSAATAQDVHVRIRSGAMRLTVHKLDSSSSSSSSSSSGYNYSTAVTHLQSSSSDVKLSGVSCAVAVEGGGVLMGSWYDEGLLYCPKTVQKKQ